MVKSVSSSEIWKNFQASLNHLDNLTVFCHFTEKLNFFWVLQKALGHRFHLNNLIWTS